MPDEGSSQQRGRQMDLQTIATRTALPVRKIRYVLDNRLLPGLRVAGQPDVVGRARSLTDLEGFAVACAATLLELGVKKEAVVELMNGLSGYPMDENPARKHRSTRSREHFERESRQQRRY